MTLKLIGQRFNRLTVESQNLIRSLNGNIRWDCICDCGNRTTVVGNSLINGNTTSCGCYQKQRVSEHCKSNTTHGMSNTPEYNAWNSIIKRCIHQNTVNYDNYGGRGITVCERWLNSFEAFYEDMGPRPSPDHSIDREENDKGYYKENCRWATPTEQANNRRSNVFYEYRGNQYTIPQLSRLPEAIKNGLSTNCLYARINTLDYSIEDALNKPNGTIYTHNGITKTIKEWSIVYNINYQKLYSRLIILKWNFEKAVNTP